MVPSRLNLFLKQKGIHQKDLAEAIGRSQSTVSDIANCKMKPGLETSLLIEDYTEGEITSRMLLEDFNNKETPQSS